MKRKELLNNRHSRFPGNAESIFRVLNSSEKGLTREQAARSRELFGKNQITRGKKIPLWKRLAGAFLNPFSAVLLALAAVSVITDVLLAAPEEKNPMTALIIAILVAFSGILRFAQETRSGNAAASLSRMIRTTACVVRPEECAAEIPLEDIAVGDVIRLSAGDMVPADLQILQARDLFISQSALTGESEPVEKTAAGPQAVGQGTDCPFLAFLGSSVISGSATAVAVAVGDDTLLGETAGKLQAPPEKTTFEKDVNAVSWILIRFMLVMVPVVLFLNGMTDGDWMSAALFAISVAVGLTPEMLPMIVTTCLARGAVAMANKKVIIKNLNAIQNLGSADILCTDKTGTLTQDRVALEYHLDLSGQENRRILGYAFLNSYFQTGLKNLIDRAVIEKARTEEMHAAEQLYTKVDEIPFDFQRRRMSVVVKGTDGKTLLITKGAVEEMLRISDRAEMEGKTVPLTGEIRQNVLRHAEKLQEDGMRVLGLAIRHDPSPAGVFSPKEENRMILIGYLAFLDPPKESTAEAVSALHRRGVKIKVLTGDNERVTACVCRKTGIPADRILLGTQIRRMSDQELAHSCEETDIFARLSPAEKARVIKALRNNGHTVAYMGDGINDAPAMKAADAGISVDSAVDIAKESAQIVLLEKDLRVLEQGIVEGRKTCVNMLKYIKMTASSNFGNMFSVLAASAFLPFLPMASLQLILLNMAYDLSCTAIPWDNVDPEFLEKPGKWDASSIGKFMIRIGPVSSVFDLITYLLLYFVLCPAVCGGAFSALDASGRELFIALFQTGWFVESMWSQTLVIHLIRTARTPFLQSRASLPVTLLTGTGIGILTLLPYTAAGTALGLCPLPAIYFLWLAALLSGYMLLVTLAKKNYIRKYGGLL
jgi:Mg2+-importing ATPase